MHKILFLLYCNLLLFSFQLHAQAKVFTAGQDGYQSFRIPAIVKAPNGNLLAFCEGRINGMNDFGNIKIVMKTSADNGKTWSALAVVASNDSLQAGNPAPVVDLTDPNCPGGRILLFYNTGNASESQIRQGKGQREVWYKTSADNGKTWGQPVIISSEVKNSYQVDGSAKKNAGKDWRSYANTPGHALQISSGRFRGRIYVAANHSSGAPQPQFRDYRAHGYYTDDHAATFHVSESVPFEGSNESTAAELVNGGLMMNSRNQRGKYRVVSVSSNGGASWDTTYVDHQLPDPVCEGSLLNIGRKGSKSILAFSNNADTIRRDSLTLHISFDSGKSWKKRILIEPKATGYSDIVQLSARRIGVLYEADSYHDILFRAVPWRVE